MSGNIKDISNIAPNSSEDKTGPVTFIEIFNKTIDVEHKNESVNIKLKKIVIPSIQRDYAQGRENNEINRVRDRFLNSLHNAVTKKPIILDFVYGDIDEEGVMMPLDGQQRLTTLFLLHWYAAKRDSVQDEDRECLSKFSYDTRYSARRFCEKMFGFEPTFTDEKISDEIKNQSWFPLDWRNDPTVSSMLLMLDEISIKFKDVPDLWSKLKNGAITFYFLPISNMGLTDEIYIKMNSRGKPLTQFEHFKAELEHKLREVNEEKAKEIARKIDVDWTNLLWPYSKDDDHLIDNKFLRYFWFICNVICYRQNKTLHGSEIYDEFGLIETFFSKEKATQDNDPLKNAETLVLFFDCWRKLEKPDEFLGRFISYEQHEPGKILIKNIKDNPFSSCLLTPSESFPLSRFVLLYAIVSYLQKKDEVTEEQFSRRLRIIYNLIQNSEDELRNGLDRNNMPAILEQVDHIIDSGNCKEGLTANFSKFQLKEEIDKLTWLEKNPEKAEGLFVLEDHDLLRGQISIIGTEYYELFPRFEKLFKCDLDKVDCALMSLGFYGQNYKNARYQLGSSHKDIKVASFSKDSPWYNLFHKSSNNKFFKDTSEKLVELLQQSEDINDDLLDDIINKYLSDCESRHKFEWRYYYIKYEVFRPGRYGKYEWKNYEKEPYVFTVIVTRERLSSNSYVPYFKVVDSDYLSEDDCGQKLLYRDLGFSVECENNAFVIKNRETNEIIRRIEIAQKNGIDTEDRIERLKTELCKFKAEVMAQKKIEL